MKTISSIPFAIFWFVILLYGTPSSIAQERTNISTRYENADPATRKQLGRMVWDKDSVYVEYCKEPHYINTRRWHMVACVENGAYTRHYWADDSCLYIYDSFHRLEWVDFFRQPFEMLPDSILLNGKNLITRFSIAKLDTLISFERVEGQCLLINDEFYISAYHGVMKEKEYQEYLVSEKKHQDYEDRKKNFPMNCIWFSLVVWTILTWRYRRQKRSWAFSIMTPSVYIPSLAIIYVCMYEFLYDPGAELGLVIFFPFFIFGIISIFTIRSSIKKYK